MNATLPALTADRPMRRRSALLSPALVAMSLVASIVSSLGAPLIPTIARHFHQSVATAQWSLTVALLSGAVSAPVMGRLGDGRYRKPATVGGLGVVMAGGVVAALAGNLPLLMVGRAMQGIGLGLVPLAIATARDEMPPAKVATTVALLSVSGAAGIGAGYPISGLVAEAWGLSGAFWFGAIGSGAVLLLVAVVMPPSSIHRHSPRLDLLGATLLAVALVAVLVGMAQGSDWGWTSVRTLALLLIGAAVLACWAIQQTRAANPLVKVRLLRHPAVLAADTCAMVLGVAMYMGLSAGVEFVQAPRSAGYGFSASVVVAGTVLVPLAVFMMSGSRLLPLLVGHLGTKPVLALGCLVVALSSGVFAVFHGSLWEAFVMMGVMGAGLGITYAAIPGLIVRSVPSEETGSAMGFYQVVRYMGFSAGSALAASVLNGTPTPDGLPTLREYTTVFWISAVICVVAAALSWALPAPSELERDVEVIAERLAPSYAIYSRDG